METPKPTKPPKIKFVARDSVREFVDVVVFVVALVLMLKTFSVEAFVIPTGSMAETLFGYQKSIVCSDCGHVYAVNSASEVEPKPGSDPKLIEGGCCPNCQHRVRFSKSGTPANTSGDRVLVHKGIYHFTSPQRGDVVVFKYPISPQSNYTATNYIKRLWGFGGETIAIHRGDLYVHKGIDYPDDKLDAEGKPLYPRKGVDPHDLWEGRIDPPQQFFPFQARQDYTYHNSALALSEFEKSRKGGFLKGFELIRKTDSHALAMRRLVFDNDHASPQLAKAGVPSRWTASGKWTPDAKELPRLFQHSGNATGKLVYTHRPVVPELDPRVKEFVLPNGLVIPKEPERIPPEELAPPAPILNDLGYNSEDHFFPQRTQLYPVPDLMVEVEATTNSGSDRVVLQLARGLERLEARFEESQVTVSRVGPKGKSLAVRPAPLAPGKHKLQFADFDCRLRVWIDGRRIDFGNEADFSPSDLEALNESVGAVVGGFGSPSPDGLSWGNDLLAPVSIEVKGDVAIAHLKVWQDTYFTPTATPVVPHGLSLPESIDTFYVQPGHYLCLGDNSGHSSDGRSWGLVPERLLAGKAMFVFFPFPPVSITNRLGFIR